MADNWENWDGDKKRALQALEECYGIISKASQNSKIGKSSIYRWMDEDSQFKAAVEQIRDEAVDHVEGCVIVRILIR